MLAIDVFFGLPHLRPMLTLTPLESRVGRAVVDWSLDQLAAASNLSQSTIRDFEKNRRVPTANNLAAIRRALEEAGAEIIPGGARLRDRGQAGTST